jgi:hypothetical protein
MILQGSPDVENVGLRRTKPTEGAELRLEAVKAPSVGLGLTQAEAFSLRRQDKNLLTEKYPYWVHMGRGTMRPYHPDFKPLEIPCFDLRNQSCIHIF